MSIIIRLVEFQNYMNKIHKLGGRNKFEEIIGKSDGYLTKMLKGGKEVGSDVIVSVAENFSSLNIDWLLTGRGEMLKDDQVQIINTPRSVEMKLEDQNIVLYDIEAAANLKTLLANRGQNILGCISIPNMPKCDGALYVTGDSMYPILKSGDIVAYKQIHDINNIIYGEMYLVSFEIEGDEFLAVKYVKKSDIDGCVKLVSYNQHHDPKDIPMSCICAIALVKFSVRKNVIK